MLSHENQKHFKEKKVIPVTHIDSLNTKMWTFVQQIKLTSQKVYILIILCIHSMIMLSYSGQCHSLITQSRRFESRSGWVFDPTKVLEKKA